MKRVFIILVVLLFCMFDRAYSQTSPALDLTAPVLNKGAKWRLAYLEGGSYANYRLALKSLVGGLAKLGWLEIPEAFASKGFPNEKSMWEWLGQNAKSPYLELVQDAFWSAGWDKDARLTLKREALDRLSHARDIDAVIAMGTWAGQDLANTEHATPVFVFQTSDPVAAGIARNPEDSGLPHVFAHVDPTRYKLQIRLFHDFVGFSKLGIAYEDTPTGRAYAAVEDVKQACKALGVKLVECHVSTNTPGDPRALKGYLDCCERLGQEVDAMYLTHSEVVVKNLPELLAPFKRAKIPTFAQMGSDAVQAGALMSITQADFTTVGLFYARTIAQVLHGARPNSLPQVFEDPPRIALNIDTAREIGFNPPPGVLAAAMVIYSNATNKR